MRKHWQEILILVAIVAVLMAIVKTYSSPKPVLLEEDDVVDSMTMTDTIRTYMDTVLDDYSCQLDGCSQIIVVSPFGDLHSDIRLQAFERSKNLWVKVDSLDFVANIGYGGFAPPDGKKEGDGKTPTGIFTITHYFTKSQDFSARLKKIEITPNTIWVDDPTDSLYNTYFENSPHESRKGEKLLRKDGLYDYAIVINYNAERKSGKGSAIFLHCWSRLGKPTLGCVAIQESNMLKVLNWIDSTANPMILIQNGYNTALINNKH